MVSLATVSAFCLSAFAVCCVVHHTAILSGPGRSFPLRRAPHPPVAPFRLPSPGRVPVGTPLPSPPAARSAAAVLPGGPPSQQRALWTDAVGFAGEASRQRQLLRQAAGEETHRDEAGDTARSSRRTRLEFRPLSSITAGDGDGDGDGPVARLFRDNSTRESELPAPTREAVFGLVKALSPMCFRQGTGWTWVGETGRPHMKMKLELLRHLTPTGRVQAAEPRVALRTDARAVAVMTPSRDVGTLYHLVWAHLSALHTLDRLRRTTPGGLGPVTVYLQVWNGGLSFSVAHRHFFRRFFDTYADEVVFGDDFGARAGDVVCHAHGLVGGVHMYYAARGLGIENRPARQGELVLPSAYNSLLAQFLVVDAPRPPERRLLVLQRPRSRLARLLLNEGDLLGWAEQAGWAPAAVVLEEHPLAAQYAYLSAADLVFQVHGSSMAWPLLLPPGKTFAEVAGPGGERNVRTAPDQVAVNAWYGTYGKLHASADFCHVSHLLSDLRFMPSTPLCRHDGKTPPARWQGCSLVVPRDVFVTVLSVGRQGGCRLEPRKVEAHPAFREANLTRFVGLTEETASVRDGSLFKGFSLSS